MPILGINVPDMGIKTSSRVSEAATLYATTSLSDALFTATQQRVLAALFGQPGRSCSVSELIQATGAGSGAAQREVARLAGSGLLVVEHVGRQKRYRANPATPIYDELVGIVRKTFGLAVPLQEALAPLADRIDAAFVYGSFAKGRDTATSDVDLLILSETLAYGELMAALHPTGETLGRAIQPTLYSCSEWRQRVADQNSFVMRVLAQPKLWLIGGEHELAA